MVESWSRDRIAEFLLRHREQVLAKVRRRVGAGRRAVDSDVFATLMRRLDRLALDGTLRPRSEGELWGLVLAIGTNCTFTRLRAASRLRALEDEDGNTGRALSERIEACKDDDCVHDLLVRVGLHLDGAERELWWLRMRGASHGAIAAYLGVRDDAVRQRWRSVMNRVRQVRLAGEEHGMEA